MEKSFLFLECQLCYRRSPSPPSSTSTTTERPLPDNCFRNEKSQLRCYFKSSDARTYDSAVQACRDRGFKLAEPRTEGEVDFILSLFGVTETLWIGINDKQTEGK